MMTFGEICINVLILSGFFFSFLVGKSRGREEERSKKPRRVHPICPCTHTVGEHENGGQCVAELKRSFYYGNGTRNGHKWVKCACTKYHGPKVIDEEFFHPGTYILSD